ncbi:MAG TPA: hypothetical protein VKW08_14815 [Xanthobacteraceae bacterium]|nr:hypothetical protein [Xanthobacteraceae bacterium]
MELLSADLVDRVKASSVEGRRQAALTACGCAIEYSQLTDAIALSVLQRLSAGHDIDEATRARLDQVVEAWDEAAWDEVGDRHDRDSELLERYAVKFNKARAANAVVYAAKPELLENESWAVAAEAIYEALVCLDADPKGVALEQSIRDILCQSGAGRRL